MHKYVMTACLTARWSRHAPRGSLQLERDPRWRIEIGAFRLAMAGHGRSRALRRFARKSNLAASHAANQRDGQISKTCPALGAKIFRFRRRANQWFVSARLTRQGALRTSRTRGGMRWTRKLRRTSAAEADGEVVWSWRRDAGVKFVRSKLLAGDGGKKAGHRGEHAISRKTIARGRPECFR
jgi:hypothetical protein